MRRAARLATMQLLVCQGCCCGRTERGHPPVPVEWLKAEWKRRQLRDLGHLTVSGCLGPCEQTNVALLVTADGTQAFGGLATTADYELLLRHAARVGETGVLLPPRPALAPFALHRFAPPARRTAAAG